MTIRDHIRNPIEWGVDQLKSAILAVGRAGHSLRRPVETRYSPLPAVRRIELADLRDVLARGLSELRGVPDRRQAMSRSLDQPILVSASFAAACGEQRERLVSIGRYALRGVGRPQELSTLDLAERAPPRRPRKARLARAACATLRLSARETLGLQRPSYPGRRGTFAVQTRNMEYSGCGSSWATMARPMAMVRATMPSMRSVDLSLGGLRLPAGPLGDVDVAGHSV
jgi:hypothetical protein